MLILSPYSSFGDNKNFRLKDSTPCANNMDGNLEKLHFEAAHKIIMKLIPDGKVVDQLINLGWAMLEV